MQNLKGQVVIEIGSGTGNLTYTCSLAGYNVTGFEPNSKSVDCS
ncbi:hypothetical protein [Clostridium carnis]|nr:hypothetical protein [Clostridium carnis]